MILAVLSLAILTGNQAPPPRPATIPASARQEGAPATQETDLSRAPLLNNRQLGLAIHRLETEFPELVSVHGVGISRDDRKIEALRLMAGEKSQGRPGILVVANLEGPRVYTSGIALDHARQLASAYGSDPDVTEFLDRTTVYIIPRANPDGAEARFQSPLRELMATGQGIDNDRDGRDGEGEPGDVNGDGYITMMRVPDPDGQWIEDPTDARALIEADRNKGQRGKWKLVTEGRDEDGDEEASEDPVRDAEVNRNFPHQWEQHRARSGLFPTDEPEVRALVDFVIAHKDLALVLCYDALENLVTEVKGIPDDAPAVKRVPKPGTLDSDAKLLSEIAKRYREATGDETKGSREEAGTFQAWCYAHRGLMTLSAALWKLPEKKEKPGKSKDAEPEEPSAESAEGVEDPKSREAKKVKPSSDAKHLAWMDENDEGQRFLPWQPYQHPELGSVEIGGFAPYAKTEPPGTTRIELADKLFGFLRELGDYLPRVELVDCIAHDKGGGLVEIEAAVSNPSLLPLQTAAARRSRTIRPARVRLVLPAGATILAGRPRELVSDLPGSGGREEFRWLVQGAEADRISVSVDTDNAGSDQATPEVQR